MDYLALVSANCFLKRRKTLRRLFAVSVFVSLGSLLLHIYIRNAIVRMIFLHFGWNVVMTIAAFGWKNKKYFWENWFFIYLAILFLGGIMEWETAIGIPVTFFWFKAASAALLLTGVTIYLVHKKDFMKQVFQVDIIHHGTIWQVNGYWDSGNLLRDPYNGEPVNILQRSLADRIFSREEDFMRLVPYCSLGNKSGLLSVYNAERMYIYQERRCFKIEPAVFGIAEDGLLEGKEYDVILQASVIEGGMECR